MNPRASHSRHRFSNSSRRSTSALHSFTLVEMLVSLAILSILVTLLCVMMNSTSSTVGSSLAQIESNQEGRSILDRVQMDLQNMLLRPDIDYAFLKQTPGNDTLAFYATEAGYSPGTTKRVISVINYGITTEVNSATVPPVMVRGANDGFQWLASGSGGMLFQTAPLLQSSASPINKLVAASPDVLSQAVFRCEIGFLTNGSVIPVESLSPDTPISNVNAIVMTIATLDNQNRKLVGTSAATWNKLIAALPDATTGISTAAAWNTNIASPTFAATVGIPAKAAGAVHVYERYFYLNNAP